MRYRPATRGDLAQSLKLLPDWLNLDDGLVRALPGLWDRLIDEPSVLNMVMEDLALPAPARIQAWGVSIVLPTEWVDAHDLAGGPRPHVTRRVYASLVDGSLPPMSDREIGLANARGEITLLNMHFSMRRKDLNDPYVLSVLGIAHECFRLGHAGFNVRAMYFEGGALDQPFVTSAGFGPRPYADDAVVAQLAPDRRPMFFGTEREEALRSLPGLTVRSVFEHHPPLFRFSASQRRLLWLALFDDSDEHLMHMLGVSVHGLKKLWRGTYERIVDQAPEFFGDDVGDSEGRRGPEKRRQVLAYVRQRLEELRPWATS